MRMRKVTTTTTSSDMATISTRSKRRVNTMYEFPTRAAKRPRTEIDLPQKGTKNVSINCFQCKKKGKTDTLLECEGNCGNKIHSTCRPPGKEGKEPWKCDKCQSCSVCGKGFSDATTLQKCHLCLTCYHKKCYQLTPDERIRKLKEKQFSCANCDNSLKNDQAPKTTPTSNSNRRKNVVSQLDSVPEVDSNSDDDNEKSKDSSEDEEFLGFSAADLKELPTFIHRSKSVDLTRASHRNVSDVVAKNDRNIIDNEALLPLPDATKWSVNEVFEYFKNIFPRHAHVFEDEEIDGQALYSLQREDAQRFKLKIGPSLNIYSHIEQMQIERKQKNK